VSSKVLKIYTKGAIRDRKWKKDRQYNGQMKTDIMTKNDLQNTTQLWVTNGA